MDLSHFNASTVEPWTLDACPLDMDVTITQVDIDERHRFRLLELGLRPGCRIRVVQRSNFRGRVVARGTERIAIDGWTARRIQVATNRHPPSGHLPH